MSLTDASEDALLSLIFNNVDWANIGDAAGLQNSLTLGSVYISLHTADPGETGAVDQTTNEATFGSYARETVARGVAQWTVASGACTNDNAITFTTATSGSETITHFGIGSAVSGAGNLYMSGALDSSRAVSNGITLEFAASTLTITAT